MSEENISRSNLHERMLPTLAGVEPATSWSPVGRASNSATEAGTITSATTTTTTYNNNNNNNNNTVDSHYLEIQGISETLRDIHTSTYQISQNWGSVSFIQSYCVPYFSIRFVITSRKVELPAWFVVRNRTFGRVHPAKSHPVSILRKSISGRHRPVRVADGPMTARCRFT